MKKIILINLYILTVVLLSVNPLRALLLTDISGSYINLGEEGSVRGGGITLLWDAPRYFDNNKVLFYINSTYAVKLKSDDKPGLIYVPASAGFEYRYQVYGTQLYTTGSAGAGVSYFRKEGADILLPSLTRIESTSGPYADAMLGLNYVFTPDLDFFIRGGYQLSWYKDDKIDAPAGFQMTAGLRIPLSGNHRSLGEVDEWQDDSSGPVKNEAGTRPARGKTIITFTPGVIVPTGSFGDKYKAGYGGMISLTRRNLFFRKFEAGITPGFYYIPGRDLMSAGNKDYRRMMLIPVYLTAGYNIGRSPFFVKPVISIGAAYHDSRYKDGLSIPPDKKERSFEPSAKSGLTAEYRVTGSLYFSAVCEYGAVIEKNSVMNFITAGAGIGYYF